MLDVNDIFDYAIKEFPRWMDIRKRHSISNGGKYLHSIIDELYTIEYELYKYKKDFFAINYIDKENTIIDYVYYCNIGEVELDDIKLITPACDITQSVQDFYLKHYNAYYQEGMLYFIHNYEKITYSYKGNIYDISLKRQHVWNILDEFALFMGLKRFDKETNKELLNRIFRVFKYPTNSTEKGIKNTILNALSNVDNSLTHDDIKVELPSEKNLYKKYDKSVDIIDFLIDFNHDVYRSKIWDKNKWDHDFVDLSYVPIKWDEDIKNTVNGVGYNALKANFTDGLENVDNEVTVDIYKPSKNKFIEYIRKNSIVKDIELQLKKYKNMLKKKEVSYKVLASEMIDITNENISIDCYKQSNRYTIYDVEDLIDDINNYKKYVRAPIALDYSHKYRLDFYPSNEYDQMNINKIMLIGDNGKQIDLLQKQIDSNEITFPITQKGNMLINSRTKLITSSNDKFENSKNIKTCLSNSNEQHLTFSEPAKAAEFVIDVTNMDSNYFIMPIDINTVSILNNDSIVTYDDGFSYVDGKLISPSNIKNAEVDIKTSFKKLDIDISSGDCIIETYNDKHKLIQRKQYSNGIIKFNDNNIKYIKIIKIGKQKLSINDIRYADYDIQYETTIGKVQNTVFGTLLPFTNKKENKLKVKIKPKTIYPPIIKYVYIGIPLDKNHCYYSLEFDNVMQSNTRVKIDSSCKIKLIDLTTNKVIDDNYNSAITFENNTDLPIQINLDLKNINNIKYSSVRLNRIPGDNKNYYIILSPGKSIKNITIFGTISQPIESIDLIDFIKNKTNCSNIYISNIIDGFIIKKDEQKEIFEIKKEILNNNANCFRITTNNLEIEPMFLLDKQRHNKVYNDTFNKSFYEIDLYYKKGRIYISNNTTNVYSKKTTDIKINQVFTPMLDTHNLVAYKIMRPKNKNNIDIYFSNNKTWSADNINKSSIFIELDIDYNYPDTYQYSMETIKNSTILNNIISLDDINSPHLAEYIIIPPEYADIKYEEKEYQEDIIIESDMFNKLRFSNILYVNDIVINNMNINKKDYDVLNKEGFIIWKNEDLVSETATISYRYKSPKALFFTDYSYLYKQVNYNVDAYKYVTTINKKTNRTFSITKKDLPDNIVLDTNYKLITYCSNPLYRAYVSNINTINVKKNTNINPLSVLFTTGYYYDNNREYYYLIDNLPKHKAIKNQYFESYSADFLNDELYLYQESKNYLPYSSMELSREDILNNYDFNNNYEINELSQLKELTCCDNYSKWVSFNNNIAIVNESLHFTTEDNKLSYSYLELPTDNINNMLLTLYANNPDNIFVGISKQHYKQKLNNTNCIDILKIKKNIKNGYTYIAIDNISNDFKYYLININDNILSDIIIKEQNSHDDIKKLHTKTIDKLGLQIDEHCQLNDKFKLYFDTSNGNLFQTDVDKNNTIVTNSSIEWGMTKLFSYKNDLNELIINNANITSNMIHTVKGPGSIKTKPFYLNNKNSINRIIITINDIIFPITKDFEVNIYTSNEGTKYDLVHQAKDTNIVSIPNAMLGNYIIIEVLINENKIINNIECYAEYFENSDEELRLYNYKYGYFDSKLYDVGAAQNIMINKININNIKDNSSVKYYARSYKKDKNNFVYNKWNQLKTDNCGNIINECILNNVQYIQFRIELESQHAAVSIDSIEYKVV